jgi:hypothetical protein
MTEGTNMNKKEKQAIVANALSTAATIAYASGTSSADLSELIGNAYRFGSTDDYNNVIRQAKAGRIVASFERPTHGNAKLANAYVQSRWGNLDRAGRIEAALAILDLPSPDSSKPERRTKLEHVMVRAADSAISTARKNAGIAPKKAGGRKPKAPANPPEITASVGPVKFANDDDARDYFRNVMAALVQSAEINQQTGSAKLVKGVAFRVQSILIDARKAVEAALAD